MGRAHRDICSGPRGLGVKEGDLEILSQVEEQGVSEIVTGTHVQCTNTSEYLLSVII